MAQTPEHLLYVLYEFKSKADIYGWTGAEEFEIFRELLIGNARIQWGVIRSSELQNDTREYFDKTIRVMINSLSKKKKV